MDGRTGNADGGRVHIGKSLKAKIDAEKMSNEQAGIGALIVGLTLINCVMVYLLEGIRNELFRLSERFKDDKEK